MQRPRECVMRIELSIECKDLRNRDYLSKSDPIVAVYEKSKQGPTESGMRMLGITEVIKNNLNPQFSTAIVVDYFFEETQDIIFQVVDVDKIEGTKPMGDSLGQFECQIANIVTARGGALEGKLRQNGKECGGAIVIRFEECANMNTEIKLHFAGRKLANRDSIFSFSDPFLVFSKLREDGGWTQVHKTEWVRNTADPTWLPFTLPLSRLCQGDMCRPIRIDCNDWDSDTKFDSIGWIETTAATLADPTMQLHLKHPKGKDKAVGHLIHRKPPVTSTPPSFLAYIQGGLEITVALAIDFTASNGDPRDPRSLHYVNPTPGVLNQYEQALWAVGNVLAPYDHDQLFPVYGYGAALPPDNVTSHCFHCSGHAADPHCQGVQGVMQAYQSCVRTVHLSGPTLFSPFIQQVSSIVRDGMKGGRGSKYTILLVITDGAIMDMDDTVDALVFASKLPMSVVIVGVGEADFSSMAVLDGDGQRLKSPKTKVVAQRDIVQFVKMSDYKELGCGPRLARDVLAEVPEQVVSYFMSQGIDPTPPRAVKL